MTSPSDAPETIDRRQLRWVVYVLLIALSLGHMAGRILAVNSVDRVARESYLRSKGRTDFQDQRPFLSANDRSRWATVRALVEQGTYAIDDIIEEPTWDTIDKVYHDGHYYSSKPPLLATILAGEYWVLHKLTGKTLGTHPWELGRILLLINQLIPMGLFFLVLAWLVERYGSGDVDRITVMATATFATFLSTFVIVLNNHLYAAIGVLVAIFCGLRVWVDGERKAKYLLGAGFFAAFAAANDLPALSFMGLLGFGLLIRAPKQTLLFGVLGALLVAIPFFATNYLAHDTFKVPYAHEQWYDYPKSYWNDPQGIDVGEPEQAAYAFHVLIGHHGILSLTPMWVLSLLGIALVAFRRESPLRALAWLTLVLMIVVLAFYLTRDQEQRNYGGMTSGFRWMFWFIPLWLTLLLPSVHWLSRSRWGIGLIAVLLAFSTLSVSYPTWNPWTQPWIYDALVYYELIEPF